MPAFNFLKRTPEEMGLELQAELSKAACDKKKVRSLIDAGAALGKLGGSNFTPLFHAAKQGHLECMKALLAAGADVNEKSEGGETPLMRAAKQGETRCMQLLISHGALLNDKNEKGETAAIIASKCKYPYSIKVLVDVGVDLDETDNEGNTALSTAEKMKNQVIVGILRVEAEKRYMRNTDFTRGIAKSRPVPKPLRLRRP
jgi:ankyrin repeat protein